jgi:glycosyltransferase involved in cell wall biosynthesis
VARRRVLLVQPSLQPPGGGNGVAAWVLQSLVAEHRVTVLSWRPVEVDPINRFFGTHLNQSDFDAIVIPRRWTILPDHLPIPASLMKSALLMRYTRRFSDGFDVIVGVHNEIDYGRRGIQYIHYPTYLRPRPDVDLRWYHWRPLLHAYYELVDRLVDVSMERVRENVTLVNSNWTGERVRQLLDIEPRTLYPPVVAPRSSTPWESRRRGVLAIGRISHEKEYERLMRILARVRAQVPDLTFTIVGTADRHVRRYYNDLRQQAAALGPWIQFRHDLSREDVGRLMAAHRYGIHGMREEHFGMAPAEMARAGMIVWVPRGGGQMEIVGDEPALLYDSEEEAAAKMLRVIGDAAEERRLREHLTARSELFSVERFVDEIQQIVREF